METVNDGGICFSHAPIYTAARQPLLSVEVLFSSDYVLTVGKTQKAFMVIV
jgi:hypothetical protein